MLLRLTVSIVPVLYGAAPLIDHLPVYVLRSIIVPFKTACKRYRDAHRVFQVSTYIHSFIHTNIDLREQ
jgi:hypothetical protein